MTGQEITALGIVLLAASYLLLPLLRSSQKKSGCGGGCKGCPTTKTTTKPITFYARQSKKSLFLGGSHQA